MIIFSATKYINIVPSKMFKLFPTSKILIAALVLFSYSSAFGVMSVRLEGKKYSEKSFLIFYHSDDLKVETKAEGGRAHLKFDQEVDLAFATPQITDLMADNITVADDKLSLTVQLNSNFITKNIIDGEKLTAITLQNIENEVTKLAKKSEQELSKKIIEKKNSKIEYLRLKNGDEKLLFPFNARGVGAAIFETNETLYIVFDKLKKFVSPEGTSSLLQNLRRINHPTSTIFAINKEENLYYSANKRNKNWEVIISKAPQAAMDSVKGLQITDNSNKNMLNLLVNGSFASNEIIAFTDTQTENIFYTLPLVAGKQFVDSTQSFEKFIQLATLQGVAFQSDDAKLDIKITDKGLALSTLKNLEQIQATLQNQDTQKASTEIPMSYDNILPLKDVELQSDYDFMPLRREHLADVVNSETDDDMYKSRLKLAEFYFSYEMYHESASMVEAIQIDTPELFAKSPYANFLYAVNMSIIKEYSRAVEYFREARNLYIAFTRSIPMELALWQDYNEYKLGLYTNDVPMDEHLAGLVKSYPENLYWKLALADLEIYLQLGQLDKVEVILEESRNPTSRKHADLLSFYTAMLYKKQNNIALARDYLSNLERRAISPRVVTMATLENTRMLRDNNAISLKNAIQRLDAVRYNWRGDKLEYELLIQLAEYYKQNNQDLEALRTFKYTKDAFGQKINDLYITAEMVELYNKLFVTDKTALQLSDFEAISVFYEFKFLNPIGADGDDVILMVAKNMMNLDLLDNAIDLLQHQVQFRLKGDKRVITAEHLATLYLMNNQPKQAIAALQITDQDNLDYSRHIDRTRLKASAYVADGRLNDALMLLKGDSSSNANLLRRDIFFKLNMWNEYIQQVEQETLSSIAGQENTDEVNVIKLAVAYANSGKFAALKNLQSLLSNPSKSLNAIIELLLLGNSKVDMDSVIKTMPIEKIPEILQQYKSDLF